jgi:hypothetical protein
MKPYLRLACWMLGSLAACSLHAQMLWPGTFAGMTVEDVKRVFPDAHAPEAENVLPAGRGTQMLELSEVSIAGQGFKVGFFFKKGQLAVVTLGAAGEIQVKDFEKFRDILRTNYGHEYSMRNSEELQVKWKVAQTTILLTWTPMGHGFATLSIAYEAPLPKGRIPL